MSYTPHPEGGLLPFSWLPALKGMSYHQCCEIKVWCAKCLVFAQSDCSYRSRHSSQLLGPPAVTPPRSAPGLRPLPLPAPLQPSAMQPQAPGHGCSFLPLFSCFSCLLYSADLLPERDSVLREGSLSPRSSLPLGYWSHACGA